MRFKLIIPTIIVLFLIQINYHVVYALVSNDYTFLCPQIEAFNLKNQSLKTANQELNYKLTIETIDENGFPISEMPVYIDDKIFYTDALGKIVMVVNKGFHIVKAVEFLDLVDIKISFIKWFDNFPSLGRVINITDNTTLQLIYNVKYRITLYFYNWYVNKIITPSLIQLMHDEQILNISTNNVWLNSGNYTIMKVLFKDENIVKPGKYVFKITSPKSLKIICQVADMNITLLDLNGNPIVNHGIELVTTKGTKLNLSTDAIGQLIINDVPFGEYQIVAKLGNQIITKTFLFAGEEQQLFFPVEFKREETSILTQTLILTPTIQSNLITILVFILVFILVLDVVMYLLYRTKRKSK